jgi:hypothetical protein
LKWVNKILHANYQSQAQGATGTGKTILGGLSANAMGLGGIGGGLGGAVSEANLGGWSSGLFYQTGYGAGSIVQYDKDDWQPIPAKPKAAALPEVHGFSEDTGRMFIE